MFFVEKHFYGNLLVLPCLVACLEKLKKKKKILVLGLYEKSLTEFIKLLQYNSPAMLIENTKCTKKT